MTKKKESRLQTSEEMRREQARQRRQRSSLFNEMINEYAHNITQFVRDEWDSDAEARQALDALKAHLGRNKAVGGVHALLFGGQNDDGSDYDPKPCSPEQFCVLVQERLQSPPQKKESLRAIFYSLYEVDETTRHEFFI